MAKTILIVDDSRTVRNHLRRIVEGLGFSAQEAEDGSQALERCKEGMPDGILLDWNMPVMSGIDFLKKFKSDPASSKVPVVFCSTENDLNFMKQAILAGAQDYVIKPFDETIIKQKFAKIGLL